MSARITSFLRTLVQCFKIKSRFSTYMEYIFVTFQSIYISHTKYVQRRLIHTYTNSMQIKIPSPSSVHHITQLTYNVVHIVSTLDRAIQRANILVYMSIYSLGARLQQYDATRRLWETRECVIPDTHMKSIDVFSRAQLVM